MASNAEAIQALSEIAASWGGTIRLVSVSEFDEIKYELFKSNKWTTPPNDGHALNHSKKEIVAQRNVANAGTIIHEMGHAFADKDHPDISEEWPWFGWEICLARKVDCYRIWSRNTGDYIVGVPVKQHPNIGDEYSASWNRISARCKTLVVEYRIQHAKSIGLVTPKGEPIPIR